MTRSKFLLLVFIAFAVVCLSGLSAGMAADQPVAEPQAPIKFAVLAFRPKPETLARWQPLVDYLNKANLGRSFELEALSYQELEAAVKARRVGVVLTQPAHYILLANREGLYSPLATMVGKEGPHQLASFGGVIAVHAEDTTIRKIADLRGKRIAVSDTESLGGYLMQALELLQVGIRLPEDAKVVTTGVPHDKAIHKLLAGQADAAFVRTGVIEAMQREGKIDLGKLRILHAQQNGAFPFALSTRLYPEWALSAMPWMEDELTRKVAATMLGLPHGSKEATASRIHGFTIPGNYQPVEELMRRLRVPPFETPPSFTVRDVWSRYQASISLFGVIGVAFLLLLSAALLYANRGLRGERAQTRALLRQLRDSETRYRALVVSSPDWIWEVDATGSYTFASPKVFDILGYTPEEVIGLKPFDFMSGEESERLEGTFSETVKARRTFSGLENINLHKTGRKVVLETSGVPILGEDGTFLGYRGIDRDITARKESEAELERYRSHLEDLVEDRTAALQAAETRYRTVADFTFDWETWIDVDGTWLYCSPSCLRLSGHTAQEFMARPALFLDIVHPDDRMEVSRHFDEHPQCSDSVHESVFRIVRNDGAIAWIEHICHPVYSDDGKYLGRRASNRDITARKQAEMELLKAYDAAMMANVAKNAFLANMSHEMRTPLHQISGMAQLVRREPLTPRQSERMDKLVAASQHMTGMIEKILALTMIEAGEQVLEEAPIDLDALLNNITTMLQDKAAAKGLQLQTQVESIPPGLLGDAMHIQAALINLADNAVKFTDAGSVTIRVSSVEEGPMQVVLRFEVEDTGIGIDPDILPRLFSIFEQGDNSMTRKYGGTGIGLAMVRKLALIMGGNAGCRSTHGVGSTFWFTARLKKT